MTVGCLCIPRLTVGADFAEENLQATRRLNSLRRPQVEPVSCRGVGISECGGSFRFGACACGSFLSLQNRWAQHGLKRSVFYQGKASRDGSLASPGVEGAHMSGGGHLRRQTLDLTFPCLARVWWSCWVSSSAGVSKSVNTVHGSPSLHESHNFGAAESTCHWSPPLPKDPKPEAQRQKVRPCILKTLQDR